MLLIVVSSAITIKSTYAQCPSSKLYTFNFDPNIPSGTPNPTTYNYWHSIYGERDWIIRDGWTVTIENTTATFIENASITVEPGGKLILKNCTLKVDSRCDYWTGIIVQGASGVSQFNDNGSGGTDGSIDYGSHGYVRTEGAVIMDAVTGIHSTNGGIIETAPIRNVSASVRTKFLNCWRAIHMEYDACQGNGYWTPRNSNANMKCASFVQDCDFEWNDVNPYSTVDNYKFMSMVRLEYIMGLEISGCNFLNSDTRSFTHTGSGSNPNDGALKRGTGISSQNSSYWVRKTGTGEDTDFDGCPDFS